jgi:hypothetical protein
MRFHTHPLLLDGCSFFSFEMPKKIIHVRDRTAGSRGLTATTKKKLELVANLIQKKIFECIHNFLADWPVDEFNW